MNNIAHYARIWAAHDPLVIAQSLVRTATWGEELGVEEPAISYLASRFDRLGIPYTIRKEQGRPYNFLAQVGTGSPAIILNSHLDTVPPGDLDQWIHPPLEALIEDGKLKGRGACDAKGALAAMVAAFERIWQRRDELRGRVILSAVGGEETGGHGVLREIEAGLQAEAAIVGEPTRLVPHIAHKGRMTVRVTTWGKPVHSSAPDAGINAISKLAGLVPQLDAIHTRLRGTSHPLLGTASSTVTRIRGGVAVNVVPGQCTLDIDRRLLPGETPDQAMQDYIRIVERAKEADPDLSSEVTLLEAKHLPAETSDRDLIQLVERVASRVLGRTVQAAGFTATCDMTHLENLGGIPTLIYGPGDLALAHQYNEYVPIVELYQAAEVYYQACLDWTETSIEAGTWLPSHDG